MSQEPKVSPQTLPSPQAQAALIAQVFNDMKMASESIDDAYGTSDYQARLVALASHRLGGSCASGGVPRTASSPSVRKSCRAMSYECGCLVNYHGTDRASLVCPEHGKSQRTVSAAVAPPSAQDKEPVMRLSADEIYRVMQAWEQQPASEEQTRIVVKLGALRDAAIRAGDSRFVTPLGQPLPAMRWACGASASGFDLPQACPIHGAGNCDAVCEHGTALDVHCCNCHSGFIFDYNHECPAESASVPPPQAPVIGFDVLRDALKKLPVYVAARGEGFDNSIGESRPLSQHGLAFKREDVSVLLDKLEAGAALVSGAEPEKAERVFQAVVYAYEGREVPEDLLTHGMVKRAMKFRAGVTPQQADPPTLLERLERELAGFSYEVQDCWTYENKDTSAHALLRDCQRAMLAALVSGAQPKEQGMKSEQPRKMFVNVSHDRYGRERVSQPIESDIPKDPAGVSGAQEPPAVCPVCTGRGVVPNGFYLAVGVTSWTTNSSKPEQCRSCDGKGYVSRAALPVPGADQ